MAPHRGDYTSRVLPAAAALLALAACMPARYATTAGPQPAPCTDSVAARVARLPSESVTVADREHALWAQAECRIALDSQARAVRQAAAAPRPPFPSCVDSVAARVARMPPESVTVADRQRAAAAQEECRRAVAAGPPSGYAAASWPPPPCVDSVGARVARMPAESVSVADRRHAAAARQECEIALSAPAASATNPASANPAAVLLIAGAVVLLALIL